MATKSSFVHIEAAALDETSNKEIVLRGVVSPASLELLMIDDYQREAMPLTSQSSILQALTEGKILPDIELGMRGQRYQLKDGVFVLRDPVYIIDGLQRVTTARHLQATNPEIVIRLGATIHFDTTKEWERERFRILNTLRLKVSPNVLLRNKREESPAIAMLYALCQDKGFPLSGRVAWSQRMTKGEMLSALGLAKVTGILHGHKAPTRRTSIYELVPALDKAVEIVGINNMRANITAFFSLIDECWGIRRVQYKEGAIYMRGAFLQVLARLLSDHTDFWRESDEKRLMVEAPLRRKLALFPIHDPQVVNLASSGGKSRELLYLLMRDHVNSGKRTRRLTSRLGDMATPVFAETEAFVEA